MRFPTEDGRSDRTFKAMSVPNRIAKAGLSGSHFSWGQQVHPSPPNDTHPGRPVKYNLETKNVGMPLVLFQIAGIQLPSYPAVGFFPPESFLPIQI